MILIHKHMFVGIQDMQVEKCRYVEFNYLAGHFKRIYLILVTHNVGPTLIIVKISKYF